MEHPPQDVLLRFALCTASREENRKVVRHLLARCPSCAARLRELLNQPPLDPPIDPEAYDQALDRLVARARELSESAPRPFPLVLVQ